MQIELCNIATKIGGVKFTVLNNVLAFRKVPRQIRRRYSVSKRLVKLTRFQDFPRSCLDIKIYLRYHLCWVINFNTLIGCLSMQNQLKAASQWKDSILTYSQFCKTSITLQPAKQGLFSLIPEAAAHMNFAVNFVGFFRTPFLHNIR